MKLANRVLFFIFLMALTCSAQVSNSCSTLFYKGKAEYLNFHELALHETENIDFRIFILNANSTITIIAPHAGRIEIGTSEIAKNIADSNFNLYLFEGIKESGNSQLHITSDHFDEPQAIKIIKISKFAVSIHGYKDDLNEVISIGGANKALTESIAKALRDNEFVVENPSVKFKGESLENIVNKSLFHGVQLELSSKLRKNLLLNAEQMKRFSEAVRLALAQVN